MQTDFLVLQDGNELSSKGFGKGKGKIGGEKSEGEDSGFLSTMIGIAGEQAASPSRSSEEPDPKEAAPDPSSRGKSRPEDEPGAKGNDTSRARTNSLEIAQVLGNGKAQDQGSGPLKSVRPKRTKPTAPGLDRGNQASLDQKEGSNKPSRVSNRFGMKEAQNVTGEARDHKTEKGTLDETRDPKEPVPARTADRSRGKTANINIDTKRAEDRGTIGGA